MAKNGTQDPYEAFLRDKAQSDAMEGFDPIWMPDFLFDFQKTLVTWALRKGKAAILADCGLGKTPMQLVWAENVIRKTNKPVLILTPLAVASQTVREAEKFGMEALKCTYSKPDGIKLIVVNYQRLHHFDPNDFAGVVCDESSILKNFDGVTRAAVTQFMRKVDYRLLCTATAAPNDYIELGTSSEALGELGYMDMLGRFFKSNNGSLHPMHHSRAIKGDKWRFRGHAELEFWRWICSWARAIRKPSDIGGDDEKYILPKLIQNQHIIKCATHGDGFLFPLPAHGLSEQRDERRRTVAERCEKVASLVNGTGKPAVVWCNLNDEGDLLSEVIPDATQVAGADSDEEKEAAFEAFSSGKIRVIISKAVIAGLGLNWQHCAHQTWFPSHSFEQFYQGTRRSWRFGQQSDVTIDIVTSEGEASVLANLQRKMAAAETMFAKLVELMNRELRVEKSNPFTKKMKLPVWQS